MDFTTCPLTSFSFGNGPLLMEDIIIPEVVAAFMGTTEEFIEKESLLHFSRRVTPQLK